MTDLKKGKKFFGQAFATIIDKVEDDDSVSASDINVGNLGPLNKLGSKYFSCTSRTFELEGLYLHNIILHTDSFEDFKIVFFTDDYDGESNLKLVVPYSHEKNDFNQSIVEDIVVEEYSKNLCVFKSPIMHFAYSITGGGTGGYFAIIKKHK